MRELDVIVAGEIYIDLILSGFDIWPQLGQEAFAKEYRREVGGGTAITACGLGKLGVRTAVFAAVGSEGGEWVARRLADCQVDTERLQYDAAEPTGFTLVATTAHDRAFITYSGANRRFEIAVKTAARVGEFKAARHVHVACAPSLDKDHDSAGTLIEIRSNGCTVSLDTGWHESWLTDPRAMDIIRQADIFFPNEVEASRLTQKTEARAMLEEFDRQGIRCVALKLGCQGSALLSNGEITFAPGIAVEPMDTTGAGDCFNAGFLYAWLNRKSAMECLRAANICGALSTEQYGGLNGFPKLADLELQMERAQK